MNIDELGLRTDLSNRPVFRVAIAVTLMLAAVVGRVQYRQSQMMRSASERELMKNPGAVRVDAQDTQRPNRSRSMAHITWPIQRVRCGRFTFALPTDFGPHSGGSTRLGTLEYTSAKGNIRGITAFLAGGSLLERRGGGPHESEFPIRSRRPVYRVRSRIYCDPTYVGVTYFGQVFPLAKHTHSEYRSLVVFMQTQKPSGPAFSRMMQSVRWR